MTGAVTKPDPLREESWRLAVCDLVWFGFPLREGLSERAVVDYELPVGEALPQSDVDGIHRLLLETCAKLVEPGRPVIVPLSGGLDSRLVLATLLELLPRRDVYCYTYGFPGTLDSEIAPLVARAAGVHHVQRSFDEITFDPDELAQLTDAWDLETALHHNLPSYYYTRKITALCLADLPPEAPLYSGFLGDRLLTGKWLDRPAQSLAESASEYAAAYAHQSKQRIIEGHYDPVARLVSLYRDRHPMAGSSFCELFDLQQRQYYVKRSLEVAEREYVFPLAAPELVAAMLALPAETRAARRFQRSYLLRHHRDLARLPTTNSFGAPVRSSRLREQVDRALRLARERLGRRLGISLGRFSARRYSTALVESTWPEHRGWVREGLVRASSALAELGLGTLPDIDAHLSERALSQQLASVGYLLDSGTKNSLAPAL